MKNRSHGEDHTGLQLLGNGCGWLRGTSRIAAPMAGGMISSTALTPDEVAHITAYIRAEQRKAGIR